MSARRSKHFHDLRGTAATRFYIAGLTTGEIALILGWSDKGVEELIDRYVKKDELLKARILKLDKNERGYELQNLLQNMTARLS